MARKPSGSLDTNALLRLLLADVPAQTRAVEALLQRDAVYAVADVALIEMIFVLEKIYQMERPLIQENVFGIVRNQSFVCNRALFEQVMPQYVAEPGVSIIDCVLVAYARHTKATPLYTFDKKLVQMASPDAVVPD